MFGRSTQRRRASLNTSDGGDTGDFQRCNNSVATNNSYEDGIDDSIRTAKRTNTTTSSFIRRGLKGIYGTIREENTSSNDSSPFRRSGSGGGVETHHGDSSCYDQSVETNSTNDDHNSMLVENHMLIATMPLKGGDNTDVFHSDTTGTTDSSGYSGYELGNGNVYESHTSESTNSSGYSGYQRGNGNVYESNTSGSTNSSGYSGYQRGNGGVYDSNTTPTSYTTSEDNTDSYGSSQYQSSSDGTTAYDTSNYTSSNNTEATHRNSFSSTSQSSSTSNRRMGNHRRASVESYTSQYRRASVDSYPSQHRRASVDSYQSQSSRSSSTAVNGRVTHQQSRRASVDSSPSQSPRSSSTAVNRRGTDQNNILRSSISSATSSSRRRTVDNSDMSSVTRPSSRDNSSIHTGQTGGTPGVDRGKSQCPYQIQFHVQHQGKNIQGSKRVIHIRFGFANNTTISQGMTGVDCRGEEHDIVVLWSITGGKRSISMNGKEIQYEVGKRSNANRRADILEAAWRLGGHVYQLKFYAYKPSAGEKRNPKWKQYSLFIDGRSYFDLPQIFDLGGRMGSSLTYRAPPPTEVRRSNELSNSMISDFSSSQEPPDESQDVKDAIKNRIDLQRKLLKTKQKVTPSESQQQRVAPAKSDNASQISFMTVSEVSRMSSIDSTFTPTSTSATYTPRANTTTDLEEDGIDDSERTGILSCAPTELSERTSTLSSASQGRPTRRATVDTTVSLESFNSMVLSMDDEQTEIASGSSSRSRRGHANHSSHVSSTTEFQTTSSASSSASPSMAECQALTPYQIATAHQAQTARVPRRASSASVYQGQTTALVPRRASLGGGGEGVNKFGFF